MMFNMETWTRCDGYPSPPLTQVDENRWVVEPGDMTHYELITGPDVAVFRVGRDFKPNCRLVVVDPGSLLGTVRGFGFDGAREDYEVALAEFVLGLVLGHTVEEPECLACRRVK